jgi:hypothetical protein
MTHFFTAKKVCCAAIAVGALVLVGCKKDAGSKEIELPEGRIHVGAQWAGGSLWVESFDPKTTTCEFSEYKDGKVVEASTITFKNCRTGLGGPMVRPSMPNMQGRPAMNRPGMSHPGMNRPGMPPAAGQPPSTGSEAPTPVAPPPQG